jgi:putative component of toxin-antitoxin plasmid stabilization module
VQAGYLHTESMGILAIDQKGGGVNLQETRMYIYADDASQVVYLIAIGDKSTQNSDVEYSKDFVRQLRGEKE